MKFLKQSTAAVIPFGPCVSPTDGATIGTAVPGISALDHATTGIFLIKNGGSGAIRHQSVSPQIPQYRAFRDSTVSTQ